MPFGWQEMQNRNSLPFLWKILFSFVSVSFSKRLVFLSGITSMVSWLILPFTSCAGAVTRATQLLCYCVLTEMDTSEETLETKSQ